MILFLASSFKDVTGIFTTFAGATLQGKTVTFIPTAAKHEKVNFYVKSGRKALESMGLVIDEVDLASTPSEEIAGKLRLNDYIYVTGGNTFYLLQEMKKTGADKIVAELINDGKPYIGESAGAMVLSPNIEYVRNMDDCKVAPELHDFSALNVVDFYPLPHRDAFPFKKVVEKIVKQYETTLPIMTISNSQAICVSGETVVIKG